MKERSQLGEGERQESPELSQGWDLAVHDQEGDNRVLKLLGPRPANQ